MKKTTFLSGLAAILVLAGNLASAAVIVTINPNAYLSSPGVTSVDLLARSTDPSNATDQLFSMVVDVTSSTAILASPPGAFAGAPLNDAVPFWFSTAGTGGTLANSSSFSRSSNSIASLSFDFSNLGTFLSTDQRIARLDFSTTAPGVYPLSISVDALNGVGGSAVTPAFNGSFTISAIPEPTSVALLFGGLALTVSMRSRRRTVIKNV